MPQVAETPVILISQILATFPGDVRVVSDAITFYSPLFGRPGHVTRVDLPSGGFVEWVIPYPPSAAPSHE